MSKEVRVGIFSVLAIAMLYLGFNYLKGIDFLSRSNKYYALYGDVGGLTKSNPVTISGLSVGRVSDITLLQKEGNKVLVELDIDNKIFLGDSAVAFLDADLLGSVSIALNVGDLNNPIPAGDTIMGSVTPGLTELFVESTEPLTSNLPVLIDNLNDFMEELEGTGDTLKMTLASFSKTSDALRYTLYDNKDSIKSLVSNLSAMTVEMKNGLAEVQPLLKKFNILADSLNNLELKKMVNSLNAVMANASETMAALQSTDGTIGKLMHDDELYLNLNKAITDLDSLLLHINENPKHFFGPLGKSRKKIEKDLEKQKSQ